MAENRRKMPVRKFTVYAWNSGQAARCHDKALADGIHRDLKPVPTVLVAMVPEVIGVHEEHIGFALGIQFLEHCLGVRFFFEGVQKGAKVAFRVRNA